MTTSDTVYRVGAFTSFAGDLKEVIVGDMVGADYFSALPEGHTKELITRIVTETKQDLDSLATTYQTHGIRVHRPRLIHTQPGLAEACGTQVINPMPNFMPHDHVFCMDNTFVNTFFHVDRYHDRESIAHVVELLDPAVRYVETPMPELWDNEYYDALYQPDWQQSPGNRDTIIHGPAFYPCGKHIFHTGSPCINPNGLAQMQDLFPDHEFVELLPPFENHLDAQIRVVKPGLVLSFIEPEVLKEQVPAMRNWEIMHDDVWHKMKQQIYRTPRPLESWVDDDTANSSVSLGVVNIRPDLVAIPRESKLLCKTLEKANVDWVVCPQRHSHFWNYSLSCATAIIHREDHLEDYLS